MAININQTTQAQAVLSTSQLLTLIQQSAKYLFQQLFELFVIVKSDIGLCPFRFKQRIALLPYANGMRLNA